MKTIISGILLASSIFSAVLCLTGHVCYTSSLQDAVVSRSKSAYESHRIAQQCGILPGKRCIVYRRVTVYKTVYRLERRNLRKQQCCAGWRVDSSGTCCGIHNRNPIVTYCPQDMTVQATGPKKYVTWSKPTFKEPHGYELRTSNDKGVNNSATLRWGATTITYTATSTNNNKQAFCSFTIYVKPPAGKIQLLKTADRYEYEDRQRVLLGEGLSAKFTCRLDNEKSPAKLYWYKGQRNITSQARYRAERVGTSDLKSAISDIIFSVSTEDHNITLECQSMKVDSSSNAVNQQRVCIIMDVQASSDTCPAGTYFTAVSGGVCHDCPLNSFRPESESAQEQCLKCPTGSVTKHTGAKTESECNAVQARENVQQESSQQKQQSLSWICMAVICMVIMITAG